MAPPPNPADPPRLVDQAERLAGVLDGGVRISLTGTTGSGRRSIAVRAAAARPRPGGAWLVPALASRLPRALRALALAAGAVPPPRLSSAGLRTVWHGAASARPGLLIVDARLGADASVVRLLATPPGWDRCILAGGGHQAAGERLIAVPPASPPGPVDDALAPVWTAVLLGDPWTGLAVEDLEACVGAPVAPALAALIAQRRIHDLGDGRVAPSVHDAVHASERASAALRRRFVEVMVAHVADPAAAAREHDNLIAALAITRRVDQGAMAARFLLAVEAWIDDPSARGAAAYVLAVAAAAGVAPAEVLRLRGALERAG